MAGYAADANRTVAVYLASDARVPRDSVRNATVWSTRIFAGIGVRVEFRFSRPVRRGDRLSLELEASIEIEAPEERSFTEVASSHPFRPDGRIRLYYSRIQRLYQLQHTESQQFRDIVLAYVLTHEIAHVLQASDHHSTVGVMKKSWSRADFREIQTGNLQFEPRDIDLIRNGMERRWNTSRHANLLASVSTDRR